MSKHNVFTSYQALDDADDIEFQDMDQHIQVGHVFEDEEITNHYLELYRKSNFESLEYFDPNLTWTRRQDNSVTSKLDRHVTLMAFIMFMGLQIDRSNLIQALTDNFLPELQLNTDDYNLGNSIFTSFFIVSEIPSQLLAKRFKLNIWVPIQIIIWSLIAMSQCLIKTKNQFLVTRALLGLMEGGFIGNIVLWLTSFYIGDQLPIRLSIFWITGPFAEVLDSVMAYFILRLRGTWGWSGWRFMFLIEGLFTLFIGIYGWIFMPNSIRELPGSQFSDLDKKIIVTRLLKDDASKGIQGDSDPITARMILDGIFDFNLWPIYLLGSICYIPLNTTSKYFTLMMRDLGYSTLNTNLLSIPHSFVRSFFLYLVTFYSIYFQNQRISISLLQPLWYLICLVVLVRLRSSEETSNTAIWLISSTLLSAPYVHAILTSLCSHNSNSVSNRTISLATYNIAVQIGGVIASNIFREDDKPKYMRGNLNLIIISVLTIILMIFTRFFYRHKNQAREKIWNDMDDSQRKQYIQFTTDKGNNRLDFRFSY